MSFRLLIAGGGTGGHLFPGIAVAEALKERQPDSEVLFVGTKRGIEYERVPALGWNLQTIRVSGVKTQGVLGALRGLFSVPRAIWQSRKIVKGFRPDAIVGVGGYASFPVVVAGRLSGIPTAIMEQNSRPGLTNKLLGKIVRAVFLSFEASRGFFPARKIQMTGNPVRTDIVRALLAEKNHGSDRPKGLLVVGGSQGAVAVNKLVVDAVKNLAERGIELSITHHTGKAGFDETKAAYAAAGIAADCVTFIEDMAAAYRAADIVIARAGATTVAELGIVGTPALFIPYPHAADNHQELNANEMVEKGAALMFRQGETSAAQLADALADVLNSPERLDSMRSAMKSMGRPDAAKAILDWCQEQKG